MKDLSQKTKTVGESSLTKLDAMIQDARKKDKTIIALNAGQPNFALPLYLIKETEDALRKDGNNFYTKVKGNDEPRTAISIFQRNIFSMEYNKDEIILTNGAKEGVSISLAALLDSDDEVIVIKPYWLTYVDAVTFWGGKPVIVSSNNDFHLNIENVRKAITSRTKAIIINSPNNPTGVIYTEKELFELAKLIIDNDLYVISDEIYSTITYNKNAFSISRIKGMKKRTIVVNGFSKSLSVTGYRLGYVLADESVISAMEGIKSSLNGNVNSLFQMVTTEMIKNHLDEMKASFKEMRESFEERKTILCNGLLKLGIEHSVPDGAFYVFAKIPESFNMKSNEFAKFILKNAKIAISPGILFGDGYDDHIRISFSSEKKEIREALSRIGKIFDLREML